MIILLVLGGLVLWARSQQSSGGVSMPLFEPKPYTSWSEPPPSTAGSKGTGQTNPLTAVLFSLTQNFGAPAPYVPLSGPGGATTSPAASGAPSGQAQSTLVAAPPGTEPDYTAISGDLASLGNPQYWWMNGPVDVAIMNDGVSDALSGAADQDLTPTMLEASMGLVFP